MPFYLPGYLPIVIKLYDRIVFHNRLILFALIYCNTIRNMNHFSLISLVVILFSQSCFIEGGQEKPNLIIINVDDLGWKDLGFMGSKYYETPNIDALSKQGMVFTNGYASASNCAPSRACLMTGLWTTSHGIYTVGSSERGKSRHRKLIPVKIPLPRRILSFPKSSKTLVPLPRRILSFPKSSKKMVIPHVTPGNGI